MKSAASQSGFSVRDVSRRNAGLYYGISTVGSDFTLADILAHQNIVRPVRAVDVGDPAPIKALSYIVL